MNATGFKRAEIFENRMSNIYAIVDKLTLVTYNVYVIPIKRFLDAKMTQLKAIIAN